MKLPSYLKRNGFDIFHFRIKVPRRLVKKIGKTEICRSLRTSCEVTARKKAQILAHEAEELFRSYSQQSMSDVERFSRRTFDSLPQLPDRANDVDPIIEKSLDENTIMGAEIKTMSETVLLSEMIKKFVAAKELEGVWKPEEKNKNERMLKEMNEFLGDKPAGEYTKEDGRTYKIGVTELPKRTSSKALYNGLTMAECIDKKPDDASTLSLSTVNKYVEICSSAYAWAMEEGLVEMNPFRGLRYSKKAMKRQGVDTRPDQARNVLEDGDVALLFSGLPINSYSPRKASYPLDYWGVIIAAFSGARASEVAQLLCEDVVEKHGVWCFQFANDRDENRKYDKDRSQKSDNALRLVPIHNQIIELGFGDYLEQVGTGRLFPQEVPVRGRYGHRFSKDFGVYRKDMGVDGNGQTLHGFRHSHANKMSDAGIDLRIISDLHGRARGTDETSIRYIKRAKLEQMNDAIQLVEYGDAVTSLLDWSRVKKLVEYKRINAQGATRKKDRLSEHE